MLWTKKWQKKKLEVCYEHLCHSDLFRESRDRFQGAAKDDRL